MSGLPPPEVPRPQPSPEQHQRLQLFVLQVIASLLFLILATLWVWLLGIVDFEPTFRPVL